MQSAKMCVCVCMQHPHHPAALHATLTGTKKPQLRPAPPTMRIVSRQTRVQNTRAASLTVYGIGHRVFGYGALGVGYWTDSGVRTPPCSHSLYLCIDFAHARKTGIVFAAAICTSVPCSALWTTIKEINRYGLWMDCGWVAFVCVCVWMGCPVT